ncbi:DHHA1 domain-containing protein, partial [Oenococcus oeni]|uniref:DHHA1 domain-containing protein n=1 Tax=Oenococcus oeni TaxID=1247 RepID=UPI000AD54B22
PEQPKQDYKKHHFHQRPLRCYCPTALIQIDGVKSHLFELMQLDSNIATVVGENDVFYNPVLAAQVADELLKIQDVSASFVVSRHPDEKVGISARSDGSINVQLIMEKIGGGGSLSNAAVQMESDDIQEVKKVLQQAVLQITDNKEKE